MTKVRIPPTLREETGGERVIVAEGDTVRDLLDDLMGRFPALRRQRLRLEPRPAQSRSCSASARIPSGLVW